MTLKDLDLQIKSSRDPNDPLNDYREMLDHYRHIQFRKELFLNRNNKNPENCSKRNSGLPLEKQNESKPDSNNKINCSESISSRNFNIIPKILFTQNMKKLISEDKFNNDYESLFSGDKNKFRQHFKNFIIYKNKIIQIENRKKEDIMETKNARNETLFMKIVRSGESPTKFFLKKK